MLEFIIQIGEWKKNGATEATENKNKNEYFKRTS